MARNFPFPARFLELLQLLRPTPPGLARTGATHPGELAAPPRPRGEATSDFLPAAALPPAGDEPWDRLQCLGCGRIIALRQERLPRDVRALARSHDFQDLGHRRLWFGFCPRCQGKRQ